MKYTVMLVDDMPLNIEILKSILSEHYDVLTAEGGEDALKQLLYDQPDMVLLDLSMPDMDGFDVFRFMKEHKELANIPVIFVTGEQDVEAEERCLEMGAVDYVRKPYNPDIIRVKVRNHLELKAYRDDLEGLVRERTRQLDKRTKQLAAAHEAIIMGMSLMSESHDKVTGEHIGRIKNFTRLLVNQLLADYPDMLTTKLADQTIMYSPLHDVGKIAISDTILKKTGVLTAEEFEIMKAHTTQGADLLRKTEGFLTDASGGDLQVAINIAECHHERFDGTGYPNGLSGEDIPIAARVVSLADVYDALRSPRAYKKPFSHAKSMDIICKGDGRTSPEHFDPYILKSFVKLNSQFENAY